MPRFPLPAQRFLLAVLLLVALLLCLLAMAALKLDEKVYGGLSIAIGATLIPAFKRAFEWFFPARGGSDDAGGHG